MNSGTFVNGIPDITALLTNIGTLFTAMSGSGGVIANLAGLVGTFYLYQSLSRAYHVSLPNAPSPQSGAGQYIGAPFVFGMFLVNYWATQQSLTDTLGLSGGVLSPTAPTPYLQSMWGAIVTCAHGLGYISIFRGIVLLKNAADGSQQGGHSSPTWGGFWHIVGGVVMINM